MAHTKQGGSSANLRDSRPKYLGVKLFGGQTARPGSIIIRQRGNKFYPGKNVGQGKDYTLFSLAKGKIEFSKKRKTLHNGKIKKISVVSIRSA